MSDPEIKREVRKEVAKVTWIRRDYVLVGLLFTILAVLSTVVIIGNRDARDAARAAEIAAREAREAAGFSKLLEECQTPGTACYNFQQENDQREREYFSTLMKTTGVCTLVVSRESMGSSDIPRLETLFEECVNARVGPPPTPSSSTTTTTLGG